MIRAAGLISLALLSQCEQDGSTAASGGAMPSGLDHALQEIVYEPVGAHIDAVQIVRLRYVQTLLAGDDGPAFEVIEPDFQHLCDTAGLEAQKKSAPNAKEIVISIASEPVAFGESAPHVTQFIDVFSVEDGACIWGGL